MFIYRSIKNGVEVYEVRSRKLVVTVTTSQLEQYDYQCYFSSFGFSDKVKRLAQEGGIYYLDQNFTSK